MPAAPPASLHPAPYTPRRVEVGEWTVTALSDGFMRLDGGAMWGVVPANLWRKMTPPLEDNTILMALRPFLVERGDVRAVIEVGVGDRWDEKWLDLYHIDRKPTLEQAVRVAGCAPEDVTHVIASHCHFDHIGAQVVERGGELVPLFPNARHFAPREEIEVALHPDHVRRASYRTDDIAPIRDAGLLEAYDDGDELVPGLRAHDAAGHSDGVSVITVNEDGPGDTAIFWADVVPTAHHIQPPYIMAYDIDVVRSFEVRSKWLERAADGGWLGLFYHDADHAFGRVVREGRRYGFEPVTG
jgi:glyoxylase-like metal-dependent hydrolase (beta-lactamase superfamily II)